jgi:hypothetical protein
VCQVVRENYEWDNSCEGECYQMTIPKCGRGEDTAKSNVGTLKLNVRGFDWDMQLIYRGNNYMSVSNIYMKGM